MSEFNAEIFKSRALFIYIGVRFRAGTLIGKEKPKNKEKRNKH